MPTFEAHTPPHTLTLAFVCSLPLCELPCSKMRWSVHSTHRVGKEQHRTHTYVQASALLVANAEVRRIFVFGNVGECLHCKQWICWCRSLVWCACLFRWSLDGVRHRNHHTQAKQKIAAEATGGIRGGGGGR